MENSKLISVVERIIKDGICKPEILCPICSHRSPALQEILHILKILKEKGIDIDKL